MYKIIKNFYLIITQILKVFERTLFNKIFYFKKSFELETSSGILENPQAEFQKNHLEIIKVTVHHFRKIGGCLDGHYFSSLELVFISLRWLEPVGLTKNVASNRIMSFGAANS